MTPPHPDPDLQDATLADAAALLDIDLPIQCLPGVRDALAALRAHWRLVERAPADPTGAP